MEKGNGASPGLSGDDTSRSTTANGASSASQQQGEGWLLLVYRVPSEPTRLRSTVWRRLKSLGAIYLQNSAAALPASVAAERALRKLRRGSLGKAGTAVVLCSSGLEGGQGGMGACQAA